MTSPLVQYFADELRLAREVAGLTQEQLGREINYQRSTVAMVETCQRPATKDFATKCDNALKTDGRFERMRESLLPAAATPEWFRPWVDYEREATSIRWYEPLLIPGLLQTEDYARALVRDEDKVTARLERQEIFDQPSSPELVVIIEETVLRRQIGERDVMCQQLKHLANTSVCVQVLPVGADTNRHLDGSFALAAIDGMEVGYVDTPARGFVVDTAEVVSSMRQRWEAIRAEALPRRQSEDLILKEAETWTKQEH